MNSIKVMGKKTVVPPYPHHKNYVYRTGRFFHTKSLLAFLAGDNFSILKHVKNDSRNKCAVPFDILIDPTNACNLKCRGCWACDYDNSKHLSYEKLDEIFTEAKALGAVDILMTGGEPLVRKLDILKLAEKHNDLFFGIFTNGTLIDEDFVRAINTLGNVTFFISIEGFREDNDFRRGEGTFDKILNAMSLLKQYDIAFAFSLCYHSNNYETVTSKEFLDFLREQGAWFGWAFAYRPIGKNADMSLCLSAEQRKKARDNLNLYSKNNVFTIIDLFNDGHRSYGCVGAGSGYIHINAAGDVEPCAFCHYSDSNLHAVSLKEALQSPFFRAFRKAQPFSKNPLRPCPLADVPEAIVKLTEATGARSTHLEAPETASDFMKKFSPYSEEWEKAADTEYKTLPSEEKRRFKSLTWYLKLRKLLAGDL